MAVTAGTLSDMLKATKKIEEKAWTISGQVQDVWDGFNTSTDYWQGQDHIEFFKNGANAHRAEMNAMAKYIGDTLPKTIEKVRRVYIKQTQSKASNYDAGGANIPDPAYQVKTSESGDNIKYDRTKMKTLVSNTEKGFKKIKTELNDVLTTVKNLKWEGDAAAAVLPALKKTINDTNTAMDKALNNLKKNVNEAIARSEQAEKDAAKAAQDATL